MAEALKFKWTADGEYDILRAGVVIGHANRRRGGWWRAAVHGDVLGGVHGDVLGSSWCKSRKEAVESALDSYARYMLADQKRSG